VPGAGDALESEVGADNEAAGLETPPDTADDVAVRAIEETRGGARNSFLPSLAMAADRCS
jgi:hypothetical protein